MCGVTWVNRRWGAEESPVVVGVEVVGVVVATIRGVAEAIAGGTGAAEEVILDVNLGGGILHFETMDEQTSGNCIRRGLWRNERRRNKG